MYTQLLAAVAATHANWQTGGHVQFYLRLLYIYKYYLIVVQQH